MSGKLKKDLQYQADVSAYFLQLLLEIDAVEKELGMVLLPFGKASCD